MEDLTQLSYSVDTLYFLVMGPFAIFYRLFADPLRISRRKDGNWWTWVPANETLRAARKQD